MLRDAFKGAIASAYREVFGTAGSTTFNDDFNRADGSINPAKDGGTWQAIRGIFQVSSNKASSLTDSNYPIAAVDSFTSNVTIDIKGSTGSGAALWVTDSGNWWSVGVTQQAETCNCVEYYNSYTYTYSYSYISGYNGSNCASQSYYCCYYYSYCVGYNSSNCCGYTCNGYNAGTCCGYSCYGYNAGGNCKGYYCSCYNTGNCQGNYCSCYNTPNCVAWTVACGDSNCSTCNAYNVSNPIYATGYANATGYNGPYYNCQTCYPTYIRVFQSASNVVSTMLTQAVSALVQSFKVSTSSNQITIKAYSDTNQVTQIGSDIVYTATGANIYPRFGMTVVPSSYGQTYEIDEITISPN